MPLSRPGSREEVSVDDVGRQLDWSEVQIVVRTSDHCFAPRGTTTFAFLFPAGGETMILQPQLLNNFWQSFQPGKGLELTDLVQLVPSPYGQLTVFDPRLPHGVRTVSGTRDPQQVCAGQTNYCICLQTG
jgi:hypothetical protein